MVLVFVYLVLAIAGAVLPLSQFIPASLAGQFSIAALIADGTATPLATGITLDLLVAATAGMLFIVVESIRSKVRLAWIAVAGTVLIGFSFGLPFFLFLRELKLHRSLMRSTE